MTTRLLHGDARTILPTLPDASVHACITSPPYYALRSYLPADHPDKAREIGSEATPDDYLATMVAVFREVRRILRPEGCLLLNLGDSYSNKQLQMMPARLALALQSDGWILRSQMPWLKRSAMPESCRDRPSNAVEYVYLFTKQARSFWDAEAVKRGASSFERNSQYRDNPSHGASDIPGRCDNGPRTTAGIAQPMPGRAMRNSDLFYDSLEDAPEPAPKHFGGRSIPRDGAAYGPFAKRDGVFRGGSRAPGGAYPLPNNEPLGLICSDDGEPLALDVNPAAFSDWTPVTRQVPVPWLDGASDGRKRKASPDCPVHAGRPVQAASDRRGERVTSHDLFRSVDTDSHHETGQEGGFVRTDPHDTPETEAQSSGSPQLANAPSATLHNNQSHRTDRAPATSLACSASAQSPDHTAGTSGSPEPSGSAGHTPESNTEPDGWDGRPSAQTGDHSADMSSCSCEWYIEKTEKTSHFATFPPKLVEPLIRAGTSERGCCAACGAPWVRQVERGELRGRSPGDGKGYVLPKYQAAAVADDHSKMSRAPTPNHGYDYTTTGWAASCKCQAEVVPCVVLDIFAGAGTTLLVADRLQRDGIGIELSPAYGTMASARVAQDAPLLAWLEAAE